jgi:signal transduction histidine kinase
LLRTKLSLGVLTCIALTVMASGYHSSAVNRDKAFAQIEQLELHTAGKLAALLGSELNGAARTLQTLSAALPSSSASTVLDDVLARQGRCDQRPCFTTLALVDANGEPHQVAGRPIALSRADLASAAASAREGQNAGRVRAIISSQPRALVLVTATPDSTRLLAAQLALDALVAQEQQTAGLGGPKHETLVLANDGTIVFDSRDPKMGRHNEDAAAARCSDCVVPPDDRQKIVAAGSGIMRYRSGGIDRIAAIAPVAAAGEQWLVAVTVPRADVLEPLSAQSWESIGGTLGIVLLAILAGVITWRDSDSVRNEFEAQERARLEHSHTELTTLNTKLQRAAHEWRTTVDTIDAALIVLEPTGVIRRMNLAAAATLPDALPSWLGRPSERLVEFQPWSAALARIPEALRSQHGLSTDRVRDLSGRTWDLSIRPVKDDPNMAVLILARDVTDVIELRESMRRSETMAQLGAIVSGVAHEVRNPLFAISSLVDAWAVQAHRDPTPFVDALRTEVGRLRTLMTDLLEYGRPAKSSQRRQTIGAVLDAAVRSCTPEADTRGIRVVRDGPADISVLMDPRRLERVFINLIQNAVQHAPLHSKVRVEVTTSASTPDQVAISVRDSGAGFAPDDLPKIFTPFFSRRVGGFGLGLAITERIVTEHQGKIAAANDPAGGAVMTVWLPVYHSRPDRDDRGMEIAC